MWDLYAETFSEAEGGDSDDDRGRLFTMAALEAAQTLIDLVHDFGLTMALPPGIQTLEHFVTGKGSRPDNVWITDHTKDQVLTCDIRPEERPIKTDHYPYVLELDMEVTYTVQGEKCAFRSVVWDDFRTELKKQLEKSPCPHPLTNADDMKVADDNLTKAIQRTIEKVVPVARIGPWTHRWWTTNLLKMRDEYHKLQCEAYRFRALREHDSHRKRKTYENKYKKAIEKAKQLEDTNPGQKRRQRTGPDRKIQRGKS
ncbi:hypothetical protein DL96DRAFT_1559243 [Flagelloscypha sp. PMI_526]|nr:hypothetical protein DL96DRAFT_1559243 [Flagelloscypha sp. PMI_526]